MIPAQHRARAALHLFQQAEIGLRIDITENGMTYYQKRLVEAIEGQERARALVEANDAALHLNLQIPDYGPGSTIN